MGEGLHSLRIGECRIVYTVDGSKGRVVLLSVAHRRKVYDLKLDKPRRENKATGSNFICVLV